MYICIQTADKVILQPCIDIIQYIYIISNSIDEYKFFLKRYCYLS